MKLRILVTSLLISAALGWAQKPIQLADILSWKRIQAPAVSNDGEWLAYRVSPAEGDAEVVIRNLKTGRELRFPIGDPGAAAPAPDAGAPPQAAPLAIASALAIAGNSRWAAFQSYPNSKDAKKLKKDKKPIQTAVVLVELATGKKTEFDKTRRFSFSGEKATALALHRYPADAAGPATPPPAAAPGAPAADRPSGSDLLLYDLASGSELNLGNVSEFAFDKKGDWLACLIDARDKAGNGVLLRNMATGSLQSLDHAEAVYKGLTWTEKGDGLATVRGVDDKGFEDKLYTVVAFKGFSGGAPAKFLFDPKTDKSFPAGMTISAVRNAAWRDDLSAVIFGIREVKAKKTPPPAEGEPKITVSAPGPSDAANEDKADLVLWHWKDPRLQSQQAVQETQDKNFSYLSIWRPGDGKFLRLADDSIRTVNLPAESKVALGTDVREYELMGNLDGRRYEDVYVVDPATGERKLALRKARWFRGASPDGGQLLFYDDGAYYTYDTATGKQTKITKGVATTFIDADNDVNVSKPPTPSLGWSKDSQNVLLSDGWDIWKVAAKGGAAVNLTGNGKKDKIRYRQRFRLDPDEKGIDLDQPMYIGAYGEWTKKSGIGLIEPGKPGVRMLQWGDARYATLMKAKDADTWLYTRETVKESPDYYVAGKLLENGQKVTDANPQQKDFLWTSGVRIVDYTSTRGEKLQAALYLPANYDAAKKYPAVVEIYEKMSQNANSYPQPGYNGFSISAYTSNGYAVIEPDIVYKVNDPGVSAVACVVPAVKAAVATGVVDAARVGIHGHSWGGYQTAFLVTQTDVFHAAVAGAPLTDMVSMYSLIYRNTGGTNQAIFESSQGRFYGGYWDNLESYQRNSPVYHAKNVNTPLMILHNDKDGAVDQTQGIEYFNTLRRLQKPVVLLEYKGENHGLRKPENMKDYTVRMKEFFDHYLMDKPAPKWLTDGVPLLKMKDHLEERVTSRPVSPSAPAGAGGGQ
ncbi:MAG: prolyl oligopeptidase family serine peptidase [Candidatus Solibacter sp.]